MNYTPRQSEILAQAASDGRVDVETLASRFGVTPQTIRRDLNALCQGGLLARVHGGAVRRTSVSNVAYATRRRLASDEKHSIGAAAAGRIPDNCSMFVNIGTTTEQFAQALRDHRDLVVISNNINVVGILSGTPTVELILAGGVVRQSDGGIVGEAAVDFIRQFKVDYAVIGASALDEDGTILDFDYREVSVSRAIIANARSVILVCDHSKFDRTAPVRICDVAQLDLFVTDREPPERFRAACATHKVEVVVAGRADMDGDGVTH